ncbi:MAG: fumarylacetoacetate hydrolase family protein [candidate division NC10 bacterium]|nr:fumarylacetoacetate hydrolase family protein [candidate division NC10 bacterium]
MTTASVKDHLTYPARFLDGVSDARHIIGMGRSSGRSDEEIQRSLELRRVRWAYYTLALGRHEIHDSGETVSIPRSIRKADYEFELALLLDLGTKEGWTEAEAEEFLREHGRVTILNDLSCRCLQAEDVQLGLGPARSKSILGKALGTRFVPYAEFAKRNPHIILRVNGEVRLEAQACTDSTLWTFPKISAYLSQQPLMLDAGTLIGSGTFAGGSIAETCRKYPWLVEGDTVDTVEMEVEGIGILTNSFARRD